MKALPTSRLYRTAGITSLLLWVTSLFAHNNDMSGWEILKSGWLLPLLSIPAALTNSLALISCFAWYANFFFFGCIAYLIRGNHPAFKTTSIGLILALSALAPVYTISEADMRSGPAEYIRGPAIWLWLSSFAIIGAVTIIELGDHRQPPMRASRRRR